MNGGERPVSSVDDRRPRCIVDGDQETTCWGKAKLVEVDWSGEELFKEVLWGRRCPGLRTHLSEPSLFKDFEEKHVTRPSLTKVTLS